MTVRLRVNPITCEAHGLCAELLPELIRLDDWGYPIIDEHGVPPELLGLARKAVDVCPTLALLLTDDESEELPTRSEGRLSRRDGGDGESRPAPSMRRTGR
jgi:ferredoxin